MTDPLPDPVFRRLLAVADLALDPGEAARMRRDLDRARRATAPLDAEPLPGDGDPSAGDPGDGGPGDGGPGAADLGGPPGPLLDATTAAAEPATASRAAAGGSTTDSGGFFVVAPVRGPSAPGEDR